MTSCALIAMAVPLFAYIFSLGIWSPGIYVYGPRDAWYDAQIWARENSPKDAVFIAPPYFWWFYESEWRVFSERSSLVSLSDLLEVALAPSYTSDWKARFAKVAPGALAQLNGDDFQNRGIVEQAFYSTSDQAVLRAACQYHATYLVVEKPHLRNFQSVYENRQFVIYALPRTCPIS